MYFHSRLLTLQAQPEKANEVLQNALMQKLEYLQVSELEAYPMIRSSDFRLASLSCNISVL